MYELSFITQRSDHGRKIACLYKYSRLAVPLGQNAGYYMLFDPFAKVNETHKDILCSSTGTLQEKLKIGTDTYYKPGIKNWTIINQLRT